eukprot:1150331-Pelagomonas_calceolata.AAC.1
MESLPTSIEQTATHDLSEYCRTALHSFCSSATQPFTAFKLGIVNEDARQSIFNPHSPYMERQEKALYLIILQYYNHTDLAAVEITKELIEGIILTAAYKDAVILTIATDPETLQGHAVTLKRSNNSSQNANTWFLLDSHSNNPKELLTSTDWNNLQGSIMSIQQGSIWDGIYPESDLHLADSSFPFDPNTVTYEVAININTPPEPAQAPLLRRNVEEICNPLSNTPPYNSHSPARNLTTASTQPILSNGNIRNNHPYEHQTPLNWYVATYH